MSDKRIWKYEPEDENELAFVGEYTDDGRMIRFVCTFADPPTEEDAALMVANKNAATAAAAAAPDLLAALEEVVRISDRKHDAWDAAKAAIKKARGE